jgi:hypothetical protein
MKASVGGLASGWAIMPTSSNVTSPAAANTQTNSLKHLDIIVIAMMITPSDCLNTDNSVI